MFSRDDAVVTLLLLAGLYFPCSSGGELSTLLFWLNILLPLGLLLYLAWRHGTRPGAGTFVSLPIIIVITICTLSHSFFRINWGVFAAFNLIALLFALDLRQVRSGRFVYACFLTANLINIACGVAILAGNEWVGELLSNSYSQFYPELVPAMVGLHKPVLTFGTHSLAGFFLYLFFWLNWETYKARRSVLALFFAICELILLLAMASFTSVAFAMLALAQIGIWLWKRSRRVLVTAAACAVLLVPVGVQSFEDNLDASEMLPQVAGTLLDSDISGPLSRYGPGGNARPTVDYLREHPLSPIGFAMPISAYVIDSGPLEYLLRGSVPLLMLIYLGLYRFLDHNLQSRAHVLTLFLVILGFETGFTALIYYRTACLLPFLVIWLNQIASKPSPSMSPALVE